MDIENKLQEVGSYFKNKVIDGDYELIGSDQYYATVLIDDKYHFDIWTANNPLKDLQFWRASGVTDIDSAFKFTEDECKEVWKVLEGRLDAKKESTIRKLKLDTYNRLKEELGIDE